MEPTIREFESPFKNYNKNNSLVIVMKNTHKHYARAVNDLMTELTLLLIVGLAMLVISGIFVGVNLNGEIVAMVISIAVCALTLIPVLLTVVAICDLRDFVNRGTPGLREYSTLSTMMLNDIIDLPNERIFNCIHQMNKTVGLVQGRKIGATLILGVLLFEVVTVMAIGILTIIAK